MADELKMFCYRFAHFGFKEFLALLIGYPKRAQPFPRDPRQPKVSSQQRSGYTTVTARLFKSNQCVGYINVFFI